MKLDNISEAVQTRGGSQAAQFAIACNGKAFRVLSDTLYQNKIGSIVRELSCNAYDAHVAAGNTATPFVIHLPDNFEPWFSVQDFGTGLSPDAIKNVFTVYFQSSKDQSNDAIGAFGLGAKTPFSYTDQFTVTSVYNGKKSIYGMYITESGVPDYKLMMEEDTTEPDGVEIKMSVKSNDYRTFATEVQQQLAYFMVKPNIQNGSIHWGKKSYDIETPNVRTIAVTSYSYSASIIQGMVGYPLAVNLLRQKLTNPIALQVINNYENHGMELLFKIGEIGVTASREGVEYTDTTIKNIEAKLLVVAQEMQDWATNSLAGCTTDWERVKKINASPLLSKMTTNLQIPYAKRMGSSFVFTMPCMFVPATATTFAHPVGTLWSKTASRTKLMSFVMINVQINPILHTVFVIKDKSTLMTSKLAYLQSQRQNATIVVIERNDGTFSAAFMKELKDNLGGFNEFIKLSEIQLPASAKAAAARSKIPRYYLQKEGAYEVRNWSKEFSDLDDIKDTVLYVEVESLDYSHRADYNRVHTYNSLQRLGDVPALIGLRKTGIDKIKSKANFIALEDWLKQVREEVHKTPDVQKAVDKVFLANSVSDRLSLSYRGDQMMHVLKATNTDLGKFLCAYSRYKYDTIDMQTKYIADRAALFGISASDRAKAKLDRLASISKRLHKKYKFLELHWELNRKFGPEAIAEYVQVMYNHNKSTK